MAKFILNVLQCLVSNISRAKSGLILAGIKSQFPITWTQQSNFFADFLVYFCFQCIKILSAKATLVVFEYTYKPVII